MIDNIINEIMNNRLLLSIFFLLPSLLTDCLPVFFTACLPACLSALFWRAPCKISLQNDRKIAKNSWLLCQLLRILRCWILFVTRPTGYSHGSPRAVVCYCSLGLGLANLSFHFYTF